MSVHCRLGELDRGTRHLYSHPNNLFPTPVGRSHAIRAADFTHSSSIQWSGLVCIRSGASQTCRGYTAGRLVGHEHSAVLLSCHWSFGSQSKCRSCNWLFGSFGLDRVADFLHFVEQGALYGPLRYILLSPSLQHVLWERTRPYRALAEQSISSRLITAITFSGCSFLISHQHSTLGGHSSPLWGDFAPFLSFIEFNISPLKSCRLWLFRFHCFHDCNPSTLCVTIARIAFFIRLLSSLVHQVGDCMLVVYYRYDCHFLCKWG